jgi:hypothetical protein
LNAVGYHHDYIEHNLETKAQRMYRVAKESILLFQRHPNLQKHLPMFHDKTSIDWQDDGLKLISRKISRSLASLWVVIRLMEILYRAFKATGRETILNEVLERWIIGGYIYQGYCHGLRTYGSVIPTNRAITSY